jgi:hypothetical protein
LQVTRIAMFPKKVYKEWTCPVRSAMFTFPTICLLLAAAGVMADKGVHGGDGWLEFATALFWAAAPLQLGISLWVASNWFLWLHDWEHLSPLWLAVPLSNLFAASAWSLIYRNYATCPSLFPSRAFLRTTGNQKHLLITKDFIYLSPLKFLGLGTCCFLASAVGYSSVSYALELVGHIW